MAKMKRRERKAGELASRKDAIRNHCLECMGYMQAEVHRCTSHDCWLYPWRMGELDIDLVTREGFKQRKRRVKMDDSQVDE